MKTIASVVLALAALLGGCASAPMADPRLDAEAKTFRPSPGKAGVYIYRNETFGAAISMDIALDGRVLGPTASKTYYYVEVMPGPHTVRGKAENESTVSFQALADRLYFIWQEVKMGLFMARNELQLVDEATGRAGVMESQRIAPAQ